MYGKLLALALGASGDDASCQFLQTAVHLGAAYRQSLRNEGDLAYTGTVSCGGQELRAILDTGSYELVVFQEGCEGCGPRASYKPSSSTEPGDLIQVITYGSGTVWCRQVTDRLALGPELQCQQAMWLVERANLTTETNFQAILGLGPVRALRMRALAGLEKVKSVAKELESWHLTSPFLHTWLRSQTEANLEMLMLQDCRLLRPQFAIYI